MAFEDRCSPNQANSPGPIPNKTPSSDTTCTSPNDRPLKPYTCNTITPKHERPLSPLQNMAYKKPQSYPSPMYGHMETPKDNQSLLYHPYLNGFFINGIPRALDYSIPFYDPLNHLIKEVPRERDTTAFMYNANVEKKIVEEAAEQPKLTFSINNILRPEFGAKKSASKKESPRIPQQNIPYKPYDLTKTCPEVAKPLPEPSRQKEFGFRPEAAPNKRPDSANSSISTSSSTVSSQGVAQSYATGSDEGVASKNSSSGDSSGRQWPAWVYCTRYSDRPSSGPRSRRSKKPPQPPSAPSVSAEDKRPRTAFSGSQLARLKHEFAENRYLTEKRRQQLAGELGLNEAQIKIWFQNKRAKIKKSSGHKNPLALQLMAQGLYNHTTASCSEDEDEIKVT